MDRLESRPHLTSLIKSVCQKQNVYDYTIVDVKTNEKGEGYLGEIFMVTIKDKNSSRQLEMIIKAAFTEEKIRDMVPIRMSFQNEIYFYETVHPTFKKLETEHNVNGYSELVPKCFEVRVGENEEILALENLKSIGFEIFDKRLILDEEHVELIFKTYGRAHAYSFALRDQNPEEYAKISANLYNVYETFMKQQLFPGYLVHMGKLAESTLIPGEDDKVIQKFQKYIGDEITNIFLNIVTEDCDYSAILHGDCWSNNMLFKYEDVGAGKKPVEMRLIDWQLTKVGSPVCDLSYCLYSGASKKVFDTIEDYLKIYHDSFSAFLRKLGSDPEKLFPFSALKEQWKKYSKWGMIMSLGILRMKLTHKEDIIDLNDDLNLEELTPETFTNSKFDEEGYNKRIRGLLWHMYEIEAL